MLIHLRLGYIDPRFRRIGQTVLPHIGYNSYDLPHLSSSSICTGTRVIQSNSILHRVVILPKLSGHTLIDQHNKRRLDVIAVRECTTTFDWNFEHIKIAWRDRQPPHVAGIWSVRWRGPNNIETSPQLSCQRHVRRRACGDYTWNATNTVQSFAQSVANAIRARILRPNQRRKHHDNILGIESTLHLIERYERTNEKRRTTKKKYGQTDFADDQSCSKSVVSKARSPSTTAVLQRRIRIHPCALKCRQQPEEDGSQK